MKKGGFPGVSARYYYPQNMLAQDPQRDMTTSQIKGGKKKGGCGCGMKAEQPIVKGGAYSRTGRKNHSRKYLKKRGRNVVPLKGGAGFFNNFGTTTGSSAVAGQVMGAQFEPVSMKPAYLV